MTDAHLFSLYKLHLQFLDMCLKLLQKVAISFQMPVCLSVHLCTHVEQLNSHWADFCEASYWVFLIKHVNQIQVWCKSDKPTLSMKTFVNLR